MVGILLMKTTGIGYQQVNDDACKDPNPSGICHRETAGAVGQPFFHEVFTVAMIGGEITCGNKPMAIQTYSRLG
ncbi:unnamed protein product [Toxocara canis]|uniref:Peptidase S1 domain-containing protein n=1 Tax=Toxocara canis TaxID=6265 RepID=A0A183V0Y2_TOXCA|nr:unnamed protein product [Toxocara canis]